MRVAANPASNDIAMFNGFSANPYQLIGSGLLVNPASAVMFDWSHCYLQDGAADAEFGQFMAASRDEASYDELRDFVAMYTPPRAFTALGALFKPSKIRGALKNAKFQCDCSEFVTLAPIAARYLREVARFERAR